MNAIDPPTISLPNVVFNRTRRTMFGVFTALLVVGLVQFASGGESILTEAIYGWTTAIPGLILLERIGLPMAQPYVELTPSGLSYGGRQQVPFQKLRSFEVRTSRFRRERAWFVPAPNWSEAAGPLRWVIRRQNLPVSAINPDWRSSGLLVHLQQYASHLLEH
jgi:hypothetical protein